MIKKVEAVSEPDGALVDWVAFNRARSELGADFVRILGYFREDGIKSLSAIEDAMRDRSATALVLPAHTLKGDSAQIGAMPLARLAEHVEMTARRCIEHREAPDELLSVVVRLRPLFQRTMALCDQAAAPPIMRKPTGFGRKVVFGRA
ncbi:MAG TPA: Hpt domain-containing protein [Sphingomonas sp.]